MKKVRITVLKTTLDKELAAEYGIEGLTACPMMKAICSCNDGLRPVIFKLEAIDEDSHV